MFIKPAESGSSVGISRVTDESEIDNAMAFAFAESDCVIVEENLDGREIACGVFNKGDPSLYYNGRALTQAEIDCFNGPYVLYEIAYDDASKPSNTTRYLLTKTTV